MSNLVENGQGNSALGLFALIAESEKSGVKSHNQQLLEGDTAEGGGRNPIFQVFPSTNPGFEKSFSWKEPGADKKDASQKWLIKKAQAVRGIITSYSARFVLGEYDPTSNRSNIMCESLACDPAYNQSGEPIRSWGPIKGITVPYSPSSFEDPNVPDNSIKGLNLIGSDPERGGCNNCVARGLHRIKGVDANGKETNVVCSTKMYITMYVTHIGRIVNDTNTIDASSLQWIDLKDIKLGDGQPGRYQHVVIISTGSQATKAVEPAELINLPDNEWIPEELLKDEGVSEYSKSKKVRMPLKSLKEYLRLMHQDGGVRANPIDGHPLPFVYTANTEIYLVNRAENPKSIPLYHRVGDLLNFGDELLAEAYEDYINKMLPYSTDEYLPKTPTMKKVEVIEEATEVVEVVKEKKILAAEDFNKPKVATTNDEEEDDDDDTGMVTYQ